MAGGTFDKLVGKVRPGTYLNIKSGKKTAVNYGVSRGIAIIPLVNSSYGPAKTFISLSSDSPDAERAKLGYSIYDEDEGRQMLYIREAFKNAATVLVYILGEGKQATAQISLASETTQAVSAAVAENMGAKDNLTGCTLSYNEKEQTVTIALTGAVSEVKNTGLFDTLSALLEQGYTATINGTSITSAADFKETDAYATLEALEKGGSASFTIVLSKDDAEEEFTISVVYPSSSEAAAASETEEETEEDTTCTLTATALYGGTRGNALTFTIAANPLNGYDVTVHLDGTKVAEYEQISTVEELIAEDCPYITFSGSGDLAEVAGVNLSGGTDAEITNDDVSAYCDAWESVKFNTVCFPFAEKSLQEVAKAKIKYMRESMGKGVQVVIPDYTPDYEGVIGVTNSVAIDDDELSHAEACAWVTGATAGASYVESLTYVEYEGATSVVDPKSHEDAVAAIKNGEFFFSISEAGAVVVEYDINTLVTFTEGEKDKGYRKNRVIRVFDAIQEAIQTAFPPNKFNNNATGWEIMEGIGKSLLLQYEEAGAITNVDYDTDFLVDQDLSEGDETYFNVAIQPVDSSEKLYFTVTTL